MRIRLATPWLRVDVRVDDTSTAELLHEAFRGLTSSDAESAQRTVRCTPSDGGLRIDSGNGCVESRPGMAAALVVAAEVNRVFLDSCPHLAVHAAVLVRGDTVVVLPGASGAGKSTLAAACTQAGFQYVSDEALVVSADLGVIPYPRPLTLSGWSRAAVGLDGGDPAEILISPYLLGNVVQEEFRGRRTVVVAMRRGTAAPDLVPWTRSHAAATLLGNSFNHYRDPSGNVDLVHRLAQNATAWELHLDDPVAAASLLADLCDQEPPAGQAPASRSTTRR